MQSIPSLPRSSGINHSPVVVCRGVPHVRHFSSHCHARVIACRAAWSGARASAKTIDGEDRPMIAGYDGGNAAGGNGTGSGDNNGWSSGDNNDDAHGLEQDLKLSAALKSLDTPLPADFAAALQNGQVAKVFVERYVALQQNFFTRFLMQFPGFRDRLLADPGFLTKVGIEVGIGIFTKSTAEYNKRSSSFMKELDFVAANVVMAIIADFMLVWLPAPTASFARAQASNAVARNPLLSRFSNVFAGCPDNAFQKVPAGMAPFSAGQRFGAVVRNGVKLLGVGFVSSCLGVGLTNILIGARQFFDPSFVPLNAPQNILATSLAYGSYMATSSNLRYQLIAGLVEERGIEAMFAGNATACAALSFIVRTSNTFIGSLLWVDYIRLLGMQTASSH